MFHFKVRSRDSPARNMPHCYFFLPILWPTYDTTLGNQLSPGGKSTRWILGLSGLWYCGYRAVAVVEPARLKLAELQPGWWLAAPPPTDLPTRRVGSSQHRFSANQLHPSPPSRSSPPLPRLPKDRSLPGCSTVLLVHSRLRLLRPPAAVGSRTGPDLQPGDGFPLRGSAETAVCDKNTPT